MGGEQMKRSPYAQGRAKKIAPQDYPSLWFTSLKLNIVLTAFEI